MQTPLNRGDANYDPLFAYGYGLSYADKDTLADSLSEEGVQIGDLDKLELFNRRPIDPWQIELVGSKEERVVMNTNTVKATSIVVKSVDRNQQEDARRAQWDGTGSAQVALVTTADVQNFSGYLNSDAALVVDVKVDSAPSAATVLRMSCGTDCVSELNITEQLKAASGQGWKTITIGLSCFPDAGTKPAKDIWVSVVQPFALVTAGTLDVSFSEVSVVKGAAKAEGVSCP
jgi:beta-glucosidase